MNQLDAELVAGAMRASGAEIVEDPEAANVLLFITCSVRGHAEDRVFSNIGALGVRKRREKGLVIGLLGCMAQQYGDQVRERAPLVDVVCAPGRLAELPALVARARAGKWSMALDPERSGAPAGEEHSPRLLPGAQEDDFAASDLSLDRLEVDRPLSGKLPGHAYVVVMRGCDNFCTYCVVPHVRGPERSRRPTSVLEEVRRLVDQGARHVTLLGQAIDKYRAVEGGRTWTLADLLAAAAETTGLDRLQFITSHPRAMTEPLAAVFRDVPKICPYLHMPAQSGSDAVLARMNRGYTAAEYADRVAMVRAMRPDVAVSSDFIVGFPGESEADFEATMDLVRRMRFSSAFVFKYSPRAGTVAAARFPDDVPTVEKRRRNNAVLALVGEIAAEENQRLVGRRMRVFVESLSPRPHLDAERAQGSALNPQLKGRTPCNRIAVFDGPAALVGTLVDVTITRAGPLTLFASM
jgi:tRNA-2-methylthio-N6-dimethylallyladenosine synthase